MKTLRVLSAGRPLPAVQWHGWAPPRLPRSAERAVAERRRDQTAVASAQKGNGLRPVLLT
jgi:hypothetical protein